MAEFQPNPLSKEEADIVLKFVAGEQLTVDESRVYAELDRERRLSHWEVPTFQGELGGISLSDEERRMLGVLLEYPDRVFPLSLLLTWAKVDHTQNLSKQFMTNLVETGWVSWIGSSSFKISQKARSQV